MLADFLLVAVCFCAGVLGAILFSWGLHRRTLHLEWALADLEERITLETKRRAASASRDKKGELAALLELNPSLALKPGSAEPWWERFRKVKPEGA